MAWFVEWWWVIYLIGVGCICNAVAKAANNVCRQLEHLISVTQDIRDADKVDDDSWWAKR